MSDERYDPVAVIVEELTALLGEGWTRDPERGAQGVLHALHDNGWRLIREWTP